MNTNDAHQRLILIHSLIHWLSTELLEMRENRLANKAHELEALLLDTIERPR